MSKVTLTCKLSDGLSHSQGNSIQTDVPNGLAPGQVFAVELPVQATRSGRQVISLSGIADGSKTAKAEAAVQVEDVHLTLALQGPRKGQVGEELSIRLTINNPGSNPLNGSPGGAVGSTPQSGIASGPLHLSLLLPTGLEFISTTSAGVCNPATKEVTWSLQGLPVQQSHELLVKVRARQDGDWALAGEVHGEGVAEVRATHAVHLTTPPVVLVELAQREDPLVPGGETTYEARISNRGTVPAAAVRVRMVLPDCLQAVEATAPTHGQIQGQRVRLRPDRSTETARRRDLSPAHPGRSIPARAECASNCPPTICPASSIRNEPAGCSRWLPGRESERERIIITL